MKRFIWLNRMIREHGFTIGCEIGTGTGRTGCEIMKASPGFHLVQVAYYPNLKGDINYCTTNRAKKLWQRRMKPYHNRMTVYLMMSHDAAKRVKDGSMDFVFVDGDHTDNHPFEDIQDWTPKVRPGGLICGHDFGHRDFPEVERAVREHFGDDFELIEDDRIWYKWLKN